jgi:hypothetical protein
LGNLVSRDASENSVEKANHAIQADVKGLAALVVDFPFIFPPNYRDKTPMPFRMGRDIAPILPRYPFKDIGFTVEALIRNRQTVPNRAGRDFSPPTPRVCT